MKKILTTICGMLTIIGYLQSCSPEEISLEADRTDTSEIVLKPETLVLIEGRSSYLEFNVVPWNANDKVIAWTTSAPEVATISDKGLVKAIAPGKATVTARAGDFSATCQVTVERAFRIEQTDELVKPVSFENFPDFPHEIAVARGETATFQGQLYTSEDLSDPGIAVTSINAPAGGTVSLAHQIYWVKDIRCSEHWDSWAGGRAPDAYPSEQNHFPDPLIPSGEEPVSIKAGGKKAFWVEFTIPRDLAAGIYTVRIEATGNGRTVFYDYPVHVYDVTLPEKQTMDVMQWINKDNRAMNNGQPVDMYANYSTFIPAIVELLNDYGQNCYQLLYSDYHINESVSFGAELNPATGKYEMKYHFNDIYWKRDFEFFDEHCKDLHQIHGLNFVSARDFEKGTISVTGIENAADGGIKVVDGQPIYGTVTFPTEDPQEIAKARNFLCNYFHQLQEYLRKHHLKDGRSWLDVYVQTICDEPRGEMYKAYNQIAAIMKEAAPDIKILEPIETDRINPELLDYPCPVLDKIHANHAVGNQVQWLYTCMQPQGNYANRFIRIPLFKTRLIHWVQFKYNASGYLHWGLNYWRGAPEDDPWADAYNQFIGGDMWIIWPGYRKVYPSVRLSAMRDGIRDYELLRMVERRSASKAQEICAKVVTDNANYNLDVNDFRLTRKEMLEYLENNQ